MTSRPTTECPGCGARTPMTELRCRICTRVVNHDIGEPARGLAALHPDTGFGATFRPSRGEAGSGSAGLRVPNVTDGDHDDRDQAEGEPGSGQPEQPSSVTAAPRWISEPIELLEPLWTPTRDGTDDESFDLASTIELDAPLRNGATPPPIEYPSEHFDPGELERELASSGRHDGPPTS